MIIYCPNTDLSPSEQEHLEKDLGAIVSDKIPETQFYLQYNTETQSVVLHKKESRDHGIVVDFLQDLQAYSRQKISPKKDLLARALGCAPGLKICDLTLGLAGDALKMMYFGASVTGCEQNPLVWALVKNALWRQKDHPRLQSFNIFLMNSHEIVEKSVEDFDIFYLDPMYSHERKALPKKEMQYLAELLPATNEEEWISIANFILSRKKKLVIKRAVQSPPLVLQKKSRALIGKMVRFDIY